MRNTIIIKYFFLLSIFAILSFGYYYLIFGQKSVIYNENRSAEKIPSFSFESFLAGDFQNRLEGALSDQYKESELLKSKVILLKNEVFNNITSLSRRNQYYLVTKGFYGFDNEEYLLHEILTDEYIEENMKYIDILAAQYNGIDVSKKYLYMVSTDRTIDFLNLNKNKEYFNMIREKYYTYKSDYLKINSVTDYKKYFYKTDHHWNYEGSYQGYKDIIRMIFGEKEEILVPNELFIFDVDTFGSKARRAQFFTFTEKFKAYKFSFPVHTEYIGEVEANYGNYSSYFENDYSRDINTNHYAHFYGNDYPEIKYNFNNSKKDNLLILGASDTNAVNTLIASHFNKTYVIDLRYYKIFDVNQYIKNNNINNVLYIANSAMFMSTDFNLSPIK
ncbi:MAG: hypothetical protein PHX04_05900 [Bacilli bacterium]|nr:hypothetical protein [Bacilli bacterium]